MALDQPSCPIVDVSGLDDALDDSHPAVHALRSACMETGFFMVTGHGIPRPHIDAALDVCSAFFDLPEATKRRYVGTAESGWMGYGPYGSSQNCSADSTAPDVKETFYAGAPSEGSSAPEVPEVAGFGHALARHGEAMRALSRRLLRGLSLSLGLPPDHLEGAAFSDPALKVLLASYPPAQPGEVSCGAHSDCGFLTLVCQDGGSGLQVRRADGSWLLLGGDRYTPVANLGDLAQRWTNDVYRSSAHRVVNDSSRLRRSIVVFNNLDADAVLACPPSCASPDRPCKYRAVSCGRYVAARLAHMRAGFKVEPDFEEEG